MACCRRRGEADEQEIGPFGQGDRIGNIGPVCRGILWAAGGIGNVHAEALQPGGNFMPDPAQTQNARTTAPDPALQGEAARQPRSVAGEFFSGDHVARQAKHHAHGQIGTIAGQHVRRVGDADAARKAGVDINGIIADAEDRDHLQRRAGVKQCARRAKIATRHDSADAGADRSEESRFVGGVKISVDCVGSVKRALIPVGQCADLQQVGFGHLGSPRLDLSCYR